MKLKILWRGVCPRTRGQNCPDAFCTWQAELTGLLSLGLHSFQWINYLNYCLSIAELVTCFEGGSAVHIYHPHPQCVLGDVVLCHSWSHNDLHKLKICSLNPAIKIHSSPLISAFLWVISWDELFTLGYEKSLWAAFRRINLKCLLLFVRLEACWMGFLFLFFMGK